MQERGRPLTSSILNTIDFWGPEHMRRWIARAFDGTSLPLATKRFLVDVGLPDTSRQPFVFGPSLAQIPRPYPEFSNYLSIGGDRKRSFCLDEHRDGAVIWFSEKHGVHRYVNRGVERFGLCLVVRQKAVEAAARVNAVPNLDWSDRFGRWQLVENEALEAMCHIDGDAMSSPDNFWPTSMRDISGLEHPPHKGN